MMKEGSESEVERRTFEGEGGNCPFGENVNGDIKMETSVESKVGIPTSKDDRYERDPDDNADENIKNETNKESKLEVPPSEEDREKTEHIYGSDVAVAISKEEQLKSSIKDILGENFNDAIEVKTVNESGSVNIYVTVNVNSSTGNGKNNSQVPEKHKSNRLDNNKASNGKSRLRCQFCGKVMSSEYRLECHLRKHTGETAGKCKLCEKTFSDIGSLKRHYKSCHRDKPKSEKSHLQCTFCGKVMSSEYRLQCHMGKHTGAAAGKCKFCDKNFSDIGSLKRHYKTCQRDKNFPCKLCGFVFISQKILDRHIARHPIGIKEEDRGESYGCGVCSKSFSSSAKLKVHEITHTNGENNGENNEDFSVIDLCESVIDPPDDYRDDDPKADHADDPLLPDSPAKSSGLKCRYCGKVMSNPRSLKYHETGHTRDNPITCVVCDKVFYHPHTARNHMLNCEKVIRHGSETQDKDNKDLDAKPKPGLKCRFCDKILFSLKSLEYHENKHTGENPIVCLICDKVFYHPKTARDHIKKCEEKLRLDTGTQDNIKEEFEDSDVKMIDDFKSENLMFGEKSSNDAEDADTLPSSLINTDKEAKAEAPLFNCGVCGDILEDRISYNSHMNSKHPLEPTVICQFCGRTCQSKSMSRHLKTCKLSGINAVFPKTTCEVCGKNVRNLASHILIHTGEKPYQCLECGERFSQNGLLTRHCSSVHTDIRRHKCSICEKGFKHKRNLTSHMRIHTEEEHPFQCDVCSKYLASEDSLKVHKRNHAGNKKYLCTICGKTFKRTDCLNTHRVTMHNIAKPYTCEKCGKGFLKMCYLTKHRRSCDGTGDVKVEKVKKYTKKFQCHVCVKSFSAPINLEIHMRTHTGERPFVCSICGKSFTQESSYKYHAMDHTGEKPFKCDHCGKQFKTSSHLTCHLRTHTGEKPYKCDICNREFNLSDNLARHKKIHDDERPYECKACGMTFKFAVILKRHERRHTGEKPFKCQVCERAFSDSRPLKKHMLMHMDNKMLAKN